MNESLLSVLVVLLLLVIPYWTHGGFQAWIHQRFDPPA